MQVGDVVCVYQPKPHLPKVNFQWSTPDHVVVDVRPNTCVVRSLTAGGTDVSKLMNSVRKEGGLSSRRVSNKLVSSYPVPDGFFVGSLLCRRFGSRWFLGVVDQTFKDEGSSVWKVTYSDFDSEKVDRQKLTSILLYHPLLDTCGDLLVPEVDYYVWFSENQQPQLGRVKEVDPSVSRPVTVHLFSPHPGAPDITRARFYPSMDQESNQSLLKQLIILQVILRVPSLMVWGHLYTQDRKDLTSHIFV